MAGVEELRNELALARRSLKKANDKERYRKRKQHEMEDPGQATPYVKRCCIHVYVLSDFDTTIAAEYLGSCRGRGATPSSIPELEDIIRTWFAAWPSEAVHELVEPVTDAARRARTVAQRFVDDQKLFNWNVDQNLTRGLAPRTSVLAERFDELRGDRLLCGAEGVVPRSNLAAIKNRVFFSRWRRRARVRLGHLPQSGYMETSEKRTKVFV